jgi:hypothetical protein
MALAPRTINAPRLCAHGGAPSTRSLSHGRRSAAWPDQASVGKAKTGVSGSAVLDPVEVVARHERPGRAIVPQNHTPTVCLDASWKLNAPRTRRRSARSAGLFGHLAASGISGCPRPIRRTIIGMHYARHSGGRARAARMSTRIISRPASVGRRPPPGCGRRSADRRRKPSMAGRRRGFSATEPVATLSAITGSTVHERRVYGGPYCWHK